MKIVCLETTCNGDNTHYLTVRSDSSVLRNNDNFYMPDFSQKMQCTVGYYLRVTRLAKCIPAKFASRCYDAVGVAVAFTAQDVVERNCALCRPCDEAYCFDKSIALSPDTVAPDALGKGQLGVELGEKVSTTLSLNELQGALDMALSRASELLTLKTGDIVYLAVVEPNGVAMGDMVEVRLNDESLLHFEVK